MSAERVSVTTWFFAPRAKREICDERGASQMSGTSEPLSPAYVGEVTTRGDSVGALGRMAGQKA
jgi:hypothetical protein